MTANVPPLRRLLPLVALWFACSAVAAQDKPLTIESSTMQPSLVLGRPMLTWWDVKIRGSRLMAGQFTFFIKSEDQLLATMETEELTLNGPEQRIRVLLPAIDTDFPLERLNVDIAFKGKNFSGKVSEQILRIPFATKKVLVGLIGETRGMRKRSPQRDKIIERLRFENLLRGGNGNSSKDDDREFAKTFFASIDPADFPSEPLAYCGYDIVILMGDEFRNLRKPQLQALLAWIKAGGGLYVEPHGVLEAFHIDFLRGLTADDDQGLNIQVDIAGKLLADTVPTGKAATVVACGLGNAIIRTDDPDHEIVVPTHEWLMIVGPLWKARVNPVGANGRPVHENTANLDPWGFMTGMFNRYRLPQSELLDRLMPDGVRMVPLSLLAVILFLFVLLIGPGDYFMLGWLQARKFTWLTFPTATLAVTALTVWLSNSYMSSAETRRAAIVCDLGPTGEIVRTNRFELLFVASSRRVTTNVEKGLFASLNTGTTFGANSFSARPPQNLIAYDGFSDFDDYVGPQGSFKLPADGKVKTPPMQVQGRIPIRFGVAQELAKWTPQLNRIFTISSAADKPDVDWNEFRLTRSEAETLRQHQIPNALSERVRQRFGSSAMVACFRGRDTWAYDRSQGWYSMRWAEEKRIPMGYNAPSPNGINQVLGESGFFRWIYTASVAMPNPGIFTLTKQTAPKGSATCDDLPLLDFSDPNSWMLVVIIPENDDYVVYRKLMRFDD